MTIEINRRYRSPVPGRPTCQRAAPAGHRLCGAARSAPGRAGDAALARHIRECREFAAKPGKPTELVNFGELANFPPLFGHLAG